MWVWCSLKLSNTHTPTRAPPSKETHTPVSPDQGGDFLTQIRKRSYPRRNTHLSIPPTQVPTEHLQHAKSAPDVQRTVSHGGLGVVPLGSPLPRLGQPLNVQTHVFQFNGKTRFYGNPTLPGRITTTWISFPRRALEKTPRDTAQGSRRVGGTTGRWGSARLQPDHYRERDRIATSGGEQGCW